MIFSQHQKGFESCLPAAIVKQHPPACVMQNLDRAQSIFTYANR
ncbi:MAG TPA: hypothetical protein VKF41_02455 [Bryobacteraceae bacterium]|nr:hypothetical protein [Bryobacteraceae bacterium]